MKTLIITWLSILVFFALISTPAIALECDEVSIVKICRAQVQQLEDEGCAVDDSCFGLCIAKEMVCQTNDKMKGEMNGKKNGEMNGKKNGYMKVKKDRMPPACDRIKDKWIDTCLWDHDYDETCEELDLPELCDE
jgi:hypothetical protein